MKSLECNLCSLMTLHARIKYIVKYDLLSVFLKAKHVFVPSALIGMVEMIYMTVRLVLHCIYRPKCVQFIHKQFRRQLFYKSMHMDKIGVSV